MTLVDVQTAVDIQAAAALLVGACFIALRRHMLKPGLGEWAAAPLLVQWALSGLSISLAMGFITVCGGAHATPREAAIYTVLAAVSVIMVINLHRSGRDGATAISHNVKAGIVTTFQPRDPADREAWARGLARREQRERQS